jgi:hypothetical protein
MHTGGFCMAAPFEIEISESVLLCRDRSVTINKAERDSGL